MVVGYQEAYNQAVADGLLPFEAHLELCESVNFARRYEFQGHQFTIDDQFGQGRRPGTLDEPGGFDFDSIMIYDSPAYAERNCWEDPKFCTLMKIEWRNGQKVGLSRFEAKKVPSPLDAAFVKRYCRFTYLFCVRDLH